MRLDADMMRLEHDGRTMQLTRKPFRLVDALYNGRRIVPRSDLIDIIDPELRVSDDRALDSMVKRVRRGMRDTWGRDDWIKTMSGVGYYWDHADDPAPRGHKTYRRYQRRKKRPYDPSTAT